MRAPWQLALRAHRDAHGGLSDRAHARLMFVVCSESAASAELVAAFPTAYVLQTLAGGPQEVDAATYATIEYGVLGNGVRHIVVCGHDRCRATGRAAAPEASQAAVVARCRALRAASEPLLRRAHVTMRALWLDETSGGLFECDLEGRPASRMGGDQLRAMFAHFDELSA